MDVLICYQSTVAQVGLQVDFERAPQGLAQVRCRQVGPRSVQVFWGFLQELKELFAFCLTCVLSPGFAGAGVVCQASCELLGLLCLSIVISLLLSTDFFCCLLRCSLKKLSWPDALSSECADPEQAQVPHTVPCHSPSAPACLSLGMGASTGLVELHMREPDLHDCRDKTRFNSC